MSPVSTLFLVATPIGNLEDISARALRTLKEARILLAEDTRQTRKLLSHYDIHATLVSYHEHNKRKVLPQILTALAEGDVALVSDAGTPVLNDPGYELVRAALEAGHQVSPIPGPSAPLAALVASGLPADAFLYLGYLPRKSSERQQLLREAADIQYTLIFLEAPHRLVLSLADMKATLGERQVAIARELTKVHEEIYRGTLSQAFEYFSQITPRGEFTLVVAGHQLQDERWSREQLLQELQSKLDQGESPTQIAKQTASMSGWPRRRVYQLLTHLQENPLPKE